MQLKWVGGIVSVCLDLAVEYWIERPMAHTFQLITYSEVHMQDIKDYLSYDPLTGLFTRLKSINGVTDRDGKVAGSKNKKGYVCIQYKSKIYRAHRLAWYFTYGYFPNCDVDHRNEIKDDNRLENLRLDIHKNNPQNKSNPNKSNASGFRGVVNQTGRWRASITNRGKRKHIGYYDTPEEAHAAYLCAKREHHPFWVENK